MPVDIVVGRSVLNVKFVRIEWLFDTPIERAKTYGILKGLSKANKTSYLHRLDAIKKQICS
jgi:hypothetical protein